jgi:pimeloyl-ACP methyl ester carboxylesterase
MLIKNLTFAAALLLTTFASGAKPARVDVQATQSNSSQVSYHNKDISGVNVFYREAGPKDAPTVVLLHGFPTSSHMFRNLIPQLSDRYHVIAPDYPGYGNSAMPSVTEFEYTFDNMTNVVDQLLQELRVEKYSLYLMDYGAPVGFRLATRHPERVESLIIQNGNAYDEGLLEFWKPLKAYWKDQSPENAEALKGLLTIDATKWQYTHGVRNVDVISPDTWGHVQPLLDREGNQAIQLAMFLDYGSNPGRYPKWQAYLRDHQPATLIVCGKNDHIFPAEGAHPYKRDLKNLEFHLLDTGHFALEEDGDVIAKHMRNFLDKNVEATRHHVSSK